MKVKTALAYIEYVEIFKKENIHADCMRKMGNYESIFSL